MLSTCIQFTSSGCLRVTSLIYSTMLGYDKMSSVPGLAYEKNVFGATVSSAGES